jgi:hypothetical protein
VLNDAHDEVLGGFGDWADATAAPRCDLLSATTFIVWFGHLSTMAFNAGFLEESNTKGQPVKSWAKRRMEALVRYPFGSLALSQDAEI